MSMEQFQGNPVYDTIVTGEFCNADTAAHQIAGATGVAARLFDVQAKSGNAGSVYLGGLTVTAPDGTTDTTTGIEFTPGQSRLLFVPNLNVFYMINANANDGITYVGYK